MFKAILLENGPGGHSASLADVNRDALPAGSVTVRVEYSTINYKDGLLITAAMPIVQSYPMVPGIDFAGTVEESDHPGWKRGDRVLVNGLGLGERHWGGHAQFARVDGDWLIPVPDNFTTRQAMAIGTAGYTAMLCVMRLERHGVRPGDGEVLVTGASGGVGSIAISLLSKLGYAVTASTGRPDEAGYLKQLGATSIIDRNSLSEPGAPLGPERWAAAIDAAGSHTLVNVLASLRYGGIVAATGLAQGIDLPGTLFPFIVRDVTLSGVDSVMQPMGPRREAWRRLSSDLDPARLESTVNEVGLGEVIEIAPRVLAGKVRGRTVVDVNRI